MNQLGQIFILLLLSSISQSTDLPHFTSPTGFKIPVDTIHASLPHELRRNAQDHIYDSDSKGNINGPNQFKLNLSDISQGSYETLTSHPSFHVTLNGHHINHHDTNHTTVKTHGNYKAVFSGPTKRLIAVWGPELHLLPVDHSKHPFVFVNSYRQEAEASDLAPPDIMVVGDDSIEQNITDGDVGGNIVEANTDPDCATGTVHYIEIIAVFDNVFCAMFGNDERSAISVIQAAFDLAEVPFRDQTCVRMILKGVEAHCNDPIDPYASFNGLSSLSIFFGFVNTFGANNIGVNRDIAVFFSGYPGDLTDRAIGYAYRPGSCETFGYSWVERVVPTTLAHELGHNMNMAHFNGASDRGLMATGTSNRLVDFFFLPESVANLTLYIDHGTTRDISCISATSPTCDSSCPNQCVNNQCLANTAPSAGQISCVPASHFDCAGRSFTNNGGWFNVKADCPSGYDFVEKAYSPDDPELVCCNPSTDTTTADAISTLYSYIADPYTHSDGSVHFNRITRYGGKSLEATTFMKTQMVPCNQAIGTPSPSISPSSSPSESISPSSTPSSSTSAVVVPPSQTPSSSMSMTSSPSTTSTASAPSTITPSRTPSSSTSMTPSLSMIPATSVPPTTPPSTTPSISASKTSTPTATATSSASDLTSPSATPSSSSVSTTSSPSITTPLQPSVCGDGLDRSNHILCGTRLKKTISVRNVGKVKLVFRARFGTFKYTVKGKEGRRIRRFGMITTTATQVSKQKIKNIWSKFSARNKLSGTHDVQIADIPLVSPISSCCGTNRVRIFFGLRLCNSAGRKCKSTFSGFAVRIRCGQVCASNPQTGTPMGPTQKCPVC